MRRILQVTHKVLEVMQIKGGRKLSTHILSVLVVRTLKKSNYVVTQTKYKFSFTCRHD